MRTMPRTNHRIASDESLSLELYRHYKSSDGHEDSTPLNTILSSKNYRVAWGTLAALQHDQRASIAMEAHLSRRITTSFFGAKSARKRVSVYFLPVTIACLPQVDGVTEIQSSGGVGFAPVIPNAVCNSLLEKFRGILGCKEGDRVCMLPNLISRDAVSSFSGLEFVNGLTDLIKRFEMKKVTSDDLIGWMLDYESIQNIMLSDDYPEDHRVLAVYTITPAEDYSLDKAILERNSIVNRVFSLSESVSFDYSMASVSGKILTSAYEAALASAKNSAIVVVTALPLQDFSFIRLSYSANTLLNSLYIAEKMWGDVQACECEIKSVGDYLCQLKMTTCHVDGGGSFMTSQVFEPEARRNGDKELASLVEAMSLISNIKVSTTFIKEVGDSGSCNSK